MKARRWWGWPLVPVYAAVVGAKAWMYDRGWLRARRLAWPAVSVGSLSAGGAGKTPVVIALAELLSDRGWVVDVLSRGYGRTGTGEERVDPNMVGAAARFGDEPVLIAERTGTEVWVGAERFAAGLAAEAATDLRTAARVHVLDDGFQHRKLARNMDVVVVTAEDLDDALLPAGNLREGLGALQRADVVVVREEEFAAVSAQVWKLMRAGTPIWTVRRELRFPAPLGVFGAGLRPLAFCAIARPEGFASMLAAAGCGVVDTIAFMDHADFRGEAIARIVETATRLGASGFVTTEKDAVKLTPAMRATLKAVGPLVIARLDAVFGDTEAVVRALEARIA